MTKTPSQTQTTKPALPKMPEGYSKQTSDVVGFHDIEDDGPVHGIPRAAKLRDSKLDASKTSAFVIFELIDPCKAVEGSEDDATEVQAKAGEMVGVWVKSGMRGLAKRCGVPTMIVFTGEKKLKGKPASYSPMKVFDIYGPPPGALIPIIEDNRKQSSNVPTIFDTKRANRQPGEDTEEAVGF